jgi:transmembrane sensor
MNHHNGNSSRSIDAQASLWVVCERDGMSEPERREFERWLNERPEHRLAYRRYSEMSAAFQRIRDQGSAGNLIGALRARSVRRRRRTAAALALATASLLILVLPRAMRPAHSPVESVGRYEPVRRLPDGTMVELNKNAEISAQFDGAFRRVSLIRGEALFRVAHDPGHPFIVSARGVEVRAVGTAFNVKLSPATVEVIVTEGSVRVDDAVRGVSLLPATNQAASSPAFPRGEPVLGPGQEAIVTIARADTDPLAQVNHLRPEDVKRTLSWRVPNFNFDGIRLEEAVKRLNEMNRIQIILADESLANLRISGSFSPDDPETFSRLVARPFGLQTHRLSEAEIELSRN